MLAITERAVPNIAPAKRESSAGEIVTVLLARTILTTSENVLVTLPFGPSTWTVLSLISTLTLSGTGMGTLPMRDMLCDLRLPDVTNELSTDLLSAAILVFEQPFRRGKNA